MGFKHSQKTFWWTNYFDEPNIKCLLLFNFLFSTTFPLLLQKNESRPPQMFTATQQNFPLHLRKVAVYSATWHQWQVQSLTKFDFIGGHNIRNCNGVLYSYLYSTSDQSDFIFNFTLSNASYYSVTAKSYK